MSFFFVQYDPDFDAPNREILARSEEIASPSEEILAFTDNGVAKSDKMSVVGIRLLNLFD
ncbi:MAG: hypothetical protein LBK96_06700 [Prevotellaceae bacterium]|jgi:hypothetical protein|nr:hypothetical protein [Prevotellaceae bacterium]